LASGIFSKLTSSSSPFPLANSDRRHSLRTKNINLQQLVTFYILHSRKFNWVDNDFHPFVEATPSSIRKYRIEAIETRTHYLSRPRNSNIEFTADSCPPSQVHINLNRQKSTLDFQRQDRKLFTFHYSNQLSPLSQLQPLSFLPGLSIIFNQGSRALECQHQDSQGTQLFETSFESWIRDRHQDSSRATCHHPKPCLPEVKNALTREPGCTGEFML
jgi:hypothetical protein